MKKPSKRDADFCARLLQEARTLDHWDGDSCDGNPYDQIRNFIEHVYERYGLPPPSEEEMDPYPSPPEVTNYPDHCNRDDERFPRLTMADLPPLTPTPDPPETLARIWSANNPDSNPDDNPYLSL